jgi:hypothetical protein
MRRATSRYWINTLSRPFGPDRLTLDNPGLLFGAGIVVALVHEVWRWKLGLPGHFGLVWMAAAIYFRCGSANRGAALLVGAGVAGGTIGFDGLQAHVVSHAPLYALTGLLLDLAYRARPRLLVNMWTVGIVAGTTFLAKPLMTVFAATVFGVQAGMLRHGYAFPFITHLCFGAVGGMIGYWLWRGLAPRSA